MSVIWVLLLAATGAAPAQSSAGGTAEATSGPAAPKTVATQPAAKSAKDLRQAVTDGLRHANSAKPADRQAAVTALVDVFKELGRDQRLPAKERQRLGAEIRSRLLRFATQFRHDLAHSGQRPADSRAGAAGGPGVEGLNDLVDLIEKTIGPDDWVLAQRIGGPAGLPGAAAGGQAGGAYGGIDQQTEANGQALVDLIENTVAPDSWDVRGGPGTIIYYNPLRALVIRQTGEGHDNIGDVLGGLRK
jgi:hypothetical protein